MKRTHWWVIDGEPRAFACGELASDDAEGIPRTYVRDAITCAGCQRAARYHDDNVDALDANDVDGRDAFWVRVFEAGKGDDVGRALERILGTDPEYQALVRARDARRRGN